MNRFVGRARLALGRDLTLGVLIERVADAFGWRHLLMTERGGPKRSAGEAADLVARWAGAIHGRIKRDESVVLAVPNSYDVLLLSCAVARAGGVAVPVNPMMTAAEIEHVISDSGAAVVIRSSDELDDRARPMEHATPVYSSDVAVLFYTSGTTGLPKGAEITHRGLVGAMGLGALAPTNLVVRSAVISLPVAHIMGFTALAGLAAAGVPVRFVPHFRPTDVMDEIESINASLFVGVPAMYRMMDEAGAAQRNLSSVRVWASGADIMPPDLAEKFRSFGASAAVAGRRLGKALFVEGYGLVETGGAVASKFGDRLVPLPGYRLRVEGETPEQPGELLVRGPSVLRGYHNRPAATSEALTPDGWLRTGDLARAGSMGTVEFCGRAKHVIKVGGYSVFAREVERVLEEQPAVAEAAAVGLPDERLGEVVGVAVRLMPGASVSVEELFEQARTQLAEYKQPRRIIILDELPRTGTNKVRRNALIDKF